MASKEDIKRAVRALRQLGYAVVIFSPEELEECDPRDLEESLVAYAWDAIRDLKNAEVNRGR